MRNPNTHLSPELEKLKENPWEGKAVADLATAPCQRDEPTGNQQCVGTTKVPASTLQV